MIYIYSLCERVLDVWLYIYIYIYNDLYIFLIYSLYIYIYILHNPQQSSHRDELALA